MFTRYLMRQKLGTRRWSEHQSLSCGDQLPSYLVPLRWRVNWQRFLLRQAAFKHTSKLLHNLTFLSGCCSLNLVLNVCAIADPDPPVVAGIGGFFWSLGSQVVGNGGHPRGLYSHRCAPESQQCNDHQGEFNNWSCPTHNTTQMWISESFKQENACQFIQVIYRKTCFSHINASKMTKLFCKSDLKKNQTDGSPLTALLDLTCWCRNTIIGVKLWNLCHFYWNKMHV